MKLEDYKAHKLEQKRLREEEAGFHRRRCFGCYRPQKSCLCAHVKPFATAARFAILMHPKEARYEKLGTGRLTASCLTEAEVIAGVDFCEEPKVRALLEDPDLTPMVLYPGSEALNLSEEPLVLEAGKRPLIFVIDGTWPCAKKIMRLSTNLQALPRVCFAPPGPSRFVIKQQPSPECLSTIEAVFALLDAMEQQGLERLDGAHHGLLEVLEALLAFQLRCISDPSLPGYRRKPRYKLPSERKPSKKWEHRGIIFEDA